MESITAQHSEYSDAAGVSALCVKGVDVDGSSLHHTWYSVSRIPIEGAPTLGAYVNCW